MTGAKDIVYVDHGRTLQDVRVQGLVDAFRHPGTYEDRRSRVMEDFSLDGNEVVYEPDETLEVFREQVWNRPKLDGRVPDSVDVDTWLCPRRMYIRGYQVGSMIGDAYLRTAPWTDEGGGEEPDVREEAAYCIRGAMAVLEDLGAFQGGAWSALMGMDHVRMYLKAEAELD